MLCGRNQHQLHSPDCSDSDTLWPFLPASHLGLNLPCWIDICQSSSLYSAQHNPIRSSLTTTAKQLFQTTKFQPEPVRACILGLLLATFPPSIHSSIHPFIHSSLLDYISTSPSPCFAPVSAVCLRVLCGVVKQQPNWAVHERKSGGEDYLNYQALHNSSQ
mmetsp:Transcript_13835/g.23613  ORF Transcript_13835/g.23613 Transcript_13835/m.23613 type:complete len:161 (+) Transcript_13835:359-841(+)